MKTAIYLIALSFLLAANACRRNDTKPAPVTPKEQLPPYTETGANTFGCLIDGEVFVPGKPPFSSYNILQCEYQYVSGKYIFGLFGKNFLNDTVKNAVGIGGNSITDFIKQGYAYSLENQITSIPLRGAVGRKKSDNAWNNSYNYITTQVFKGELNIKHFDSIKQIISGTFWFDAVDTATGKVVHVTDGRFDVSYYK